MGDMSRVSISVRELQRNLRRVLERVERGQTIEVTRRPRPVARLVACTVDRVPSPWPALQDRTRAVFGNRLVSIPGSDALSEGRGER